MARELLLNIQKRFSNIEFIVNISKPTHLDCRFKVNGFKDSDVFKRCKEMLLLEFFLMHQEENDEDMQIEETSKSQNVPSLIWEDFDSRVNQMP